MDTFYEHGLLALAGYHITLPFEVYHSIQRFLSLDDSVTTLHTYRLDKLLLNVKLIATETVP